jgi:phenylalanyl-tRNA synthetase alpha chain
VITYKYEREVCEVLESEGSLTLSQLAERLNVSVDQLRRAVENLRAKGVVAVDERVERSYVFSEEGKVYVEEDLPEVRLYHRLVRPEFIAHLPDDERRIGVKWAKVLGWITVGAGGRVERVVGKEDEVLSYSRAFRALDSSQPHFSQWLKRGLIEEKEHKEEVLVLKDEQWRDKVGHYYNPLTQREIVSGEWRQKQPQLSLSVFKPKIDVGLRHPLSLLRKRVSSVLERMGFQEMKGALVQSCFWNFDALFQPQDHPARDLADTFYVSGRAQLPPSSIVQRVKEVHERYWGQWDEDEARRLVLRTHTTVLSAHTLYALKSKGIKQGKFYAIGRVFRNEATDYKHLTEFHQVEGIVIHPNANFSNLLHFIETFYAQLGFSKVRFRPSYFPYTSPSVEIEAYYEPRDEWVELGGAGVFRRQVSEVLGGVYPVLAWGLALERLLLFLMNVNDVRVPYRNERWFVERGLYEL